MNPRLTMCMADAFATNLVLFYLIRGLDNSKIIEYVLVVLIL